MAKRNRGKHPNDDKLFTKKWQAVFTEATDDLCFLLTRDYAEKSALEIVGNRYKLNKRQRNALLRICASEQSIEKRQSSVVPMANLEGEVLEIDGFNLLILLESALSGAYIFKGRDQTYRDISSVHGSYKRVQKTEDAIILVGNCLKENKVKLVRWYFDQPVSNSGRLKSLLLEISQTHHFSWEVELVYNPDKVLAKSEHIIVSSDGWILDQVEWWLNLGAFLLENHLKRSNIIIV